MPEFDFDEGFERLGKAMTTGSDEIPFIAQMHEFAMKCKGVPGRVFYTDAEVFVRGILETTRDFGFDTPSLIWDCYNIEAEALEGHALDGEGERRAVARQRRLAGELLVEPQYLHDEGHAPVAVGVGGLEAGEVFLAGDDRLDVVDRRGHVVEQHQLGA